MNEDNLAQHLQQLERDLQGHALHIQRAAMNELAKIDSNLAVPLLGRLANTSDFLVRRICVMGLSKHLTEDSFQILARILAEESDANVAAEAADGIFEFGERSFPLLVAAFQIPHRWLVRQTILALFLDTTAYTELLTVTKLALLDETQSVQEMGILALGYLLKTDYQTEALALLTDFCSDTDWHNRLQVVRSLRNLKTPETEAIIAKLQQDENFRVVAAALDVVKYWH